MCHLRNMQKLAPSLQEKINKHQGNQICSPQNLLHRFNKVSREDLKLKIQETQDSVQQAVNYWIETRDTIDLHRINRNLSKMFSPQEIYISNQDLDHAFVLEPEDEAAFRSIINCSKLTN